MSRLSSGSGVVGQVFIGGMFVVAFVAHNIGMGRSIFIARQKGKIQKFLRIFIQQIHIAGNGSDNKKNKKSNINVKYVESCTMIYSYVCICIDTYPSPTPMFISRISLT